MSALCLWKFLSLFCDCNNEFCGYITHFIQKLVLALEDRETETRFSIANAFLKLSDLYSGIPESDATASVLALEKGLDDTEDKTRIVAVKSLALLLTKMAVATDIAAQVIHKIFVHLDDINPEVQNSVFQALHVIAKVHKEIVKQIATEFEPKHRNPTFCQELLKITSL